MDKREQYLKLKYEQAQRDGVVCVCKQVTERRIRKTIKQGFHRFTAVKRQTEAASSCGLCQPIVEDIINNELKK